MKNKEVIEAFLKGGLANNSTGSLSSSGNRLYSYQTCIAEYDEKGRLWYNKTRYSNTTSHHQGILRRLAGFYRVVDNIPRGERTIVIPNKDTVLYGRQC